MGRVSLLSYEPSLALRRSKLAQEAKAKEDVSFVLRLWLESAGGTPSEWRWRVQHVQSGQERYFRSLADVLDFVSICAGLAPPPGRPQ